MGTALVVVRKNQATVTCSGLADVENGIPITPETMFELASVSKQFTAAAIVFLAGSKLLGIDDLANKYITQLPNNITIRHLLWHTSGLPEYTTYLNWNSDTLTNQDVLAAVAKQRMMFSPGNKFVYCNSNYALLAMIAEKVARMPFPSFMYENVFKPLGMNSTQVLQPMTGCARGYEGNYINESPNLIYGDGSVWSNLSDMTLWIQSLDTSTEMFKSGTLLDGSTTDYGFGMEMADAYYAHGGLWAGFHNLVYLSRTEDARAVLLSNDCNTDTYGIVENAVATKLTAKIRRRM